MVIEIKGEKDFGYDFFVRENGKNIFYVETVGEYGIFKLYEYEFRKKLAETRGIVKLPFIFYERISLFHDSQEFIIDRPMFSFKKNIFWEGKIYDIAYKKHDLTIFQNNQKVAFFKNNKKWYGTDSFSAEILDKENIVLYISLFLSFYAF